LFRLKSAKQDKRIEKNLKQKQEEHQWKFQKYKSKLDTVLQKKKMIEIEDEAKREQKLEAYFQRTRQIMDKK
jgi:hypothetical protein